MRWGLSLILVVAACADVAEETAGSCLTHANCVGPCAPLGPEVEPRCEAGICVCVLTRVVTPDVLVVPVDIVEVPDPGSAESDGEPHSDALISEPDLGAGPPDVSSDLGSPEADARPSPACAADMVLVAESVCMDRYEAPNLEGALPFVMLTFDESESWCQARGKRLCFDDEWTWACAGPEGFAYPYGDVHQPGVCNDDKIWKVYSGSTLQKWPYGLGLLEVESLSELFELVSASSVDAAAAVEHVQSLYQGTAGGDKPGCGGALGVYDLLGNVEEWTRRRDGGMASFHGNLKGRFWAEPRTCQQGVKTHGDGFRFYEIGFRCCSEPSL